MPKLKDGSTISSYFQAGSPQTGADVYKEGSMIVMGQVEKIHFLDDPTNVSKTFVEYDVSVRDEKGGQSTLRNVRCAFFLGGTNDFNEVILENNEFASSGKLDPSNLFLHKNGTIVLVAFMNGSKDKPFIVGTLPHPKKRGAKRADGIRKLGEFRGLEWNINKDGELIITYRGNRSPNGKLVRENTGPTVIKIDKTGAISVTDNEGQLIKMDRVAKSIKITTKENLEVTVGKDQITTVTGNHQESVQGDETRTIQGNETVTTTGDRVHSAANHTLTGGGNIKIGSAGATENLVLGIQFQTLYNAHTHIGNLGVPTGTPINPMTAAQLAAKNFTE